MRAVPPAATLTLLRMNDQRHLARLSALPERVYVSAARAVDEPQ